MNLSADTNEKSVAGRNETKHDVLYKIQSFISTLSPELHIEVLRIIHANASDSINENSNGCFINISTLSPKCISEIWDYINFSKSRDDAIHRIEKKIGKLESDFFSK